MEDFVLSLVPFIAIGLIVLVMFIRTKGSSADTARHNRRSTAKKHVDKHASAHSGCEHEEVVEEDTLPATYTMHWDVFRAYVEKIFKMDYPNIEKPIYRYCGSPDFTLVTKNKKVDIHLLQVKDDVVVPDDWFKSAVKSCNTQDDILDIFVTNGKFSVKQGMLASQKHIKLINGEELAVQIRRYKTLK